VAEAEGAVDGEVVGVGVDMMAAAMKTEAVAGAGAGAVVVAEAGVDDHVRAPRHLAVALATTLAVEAVVVAEAGVDMTAHSSAGHPRSPSDFAVNTDPFGDRPAEAGAVALALAALAEGRAVAASAARA
jgi:hypothetical protein